MARPVPLRGVIEGFYGPPWPHDARVDLMEFLAERGLNAYVYAPKDEPKHRARWRDSYDAGEVDRFRDFASRCAAAGIRFGFAISPGLDIDYADATDRRSLLAKLDALVELGIDWITLALDDIPIRPGLARDQADLTAWLLDALRARRPQTRLSLVPTEYVGTRPSLYLVELVAGVPLDVDLMWTGPTVCSPVIAADDARRWQEAVAPRPLILWDNFPVNDVVMERELHLGAYTGRDAELTELVDGVLCNPMLQPHASKVALATAAAFLTAPDRYDEATAWHVAIDAVGAEHAGALRSLARACADGPLLAPEQLEANMLVDELNAALGTADQPKTLAALRGVFDEMRVAARWAEAEDDPLAREVRPWLEQGALEAQAGLAAVRLLEQLAAPDAGMAMIDVFALLFTWSAARDAPSRVVFGPRFALHPAVIQLRDGRPGVDVALALREDRSAVDRLCRLALDEYQRWVDRIDTADPAPEARAT